MDWGNLAVAALGAWTAYAEWRAKKRKKERDELVMEKVRLETELDQIRTEAGTKAPWENRLYHQTKQAMERFARTKRGS